MLTVCQCRDVFIPKCFLFSIVLRCRNLPKMDLIGTCDPYVVLELLPDSFNYKHSTEKRTTIHKRTYHPEYNELLQW